MHQVEIYLQTVNLYSNLTYKLSLAIDNMTIVIETLGKSFSAYTNAKSKAMIWYKERRNKNR